MKLTQSAAEQAAERHDTLAELNDKMRELDVIIEYLEKVEKVLSQMGFDVKNAIDIMKLEQM